MFCMCKKAEKKEQALPSLQAAYWDDIANLFLLAAVQTTVPTCRITQNAVLNAYTNIFIFQNIETLNIALQLTVWSEHSPV